MFGVEGQRTVDARSETPEQAERFRHEALFYAGADDFVVALAPFLRDGAARGEPTLVVVGSHKIDRLRRELGTDTGGIQFADMADVGHNPARIIPAWHDFVERNAAPGVRLRGVGEPIFPERTTDELVECQRHESLLNLAFAEADAFWLLCPYDTRALPRPVLEEACRSHPFVMSEHVHDHEAVYEGPDAIAAPFAKPLSAPPPGALTCTVTPGSLGAMRLLVGKRLAELGLDRERQFDFVLAVNEIATNSLEHGAGEATLLLWETGSGVVCEIRDHGRFEDPLAGRRPPTPDDPRGRGLWIANQLCDLVQIRSSTAGTAVRIHLAT
jgi:anti-sigma regulatory factor (Ser/Thr protein kinase)